MRVVSYRENIRDGDSVLGLRVDLPHGRGCRDTSHESKSCICRVEGNRSVVIREAVLPSRGGGGGGVALLGMGESPDPSGADVACCGDV